MNKVLTERWNSVVGQDDIIYCLGDFAYGRGTNPAKYFYRLNGEKHLVIGNHDGKETLDLPWTTINDTAEIKTHYGTIVLCHYAMKVWNKSHRGSWMLYGHSHLTLPEDSSMSFDVGVDGWNFTPVSLPQISRKMEWKRNNPGYFNSVPKTRDEIFLFNQQTNRQFL